MRLEEVAEHLHGVDPLWSWDSLLGTLRPQDDPLLPAVMDQTNLEGREGRRGHERYVHPRGCGSSCAFNCRVGIEATNHIFHGDFALCEQWYKNAIIVNVFPVGVALLARVVEPKNREHAL